MKWKIKRVQSKDLLLQGLIITLFIVAGILTINKSDVEHKQKFIDISLAQDKYKCYNEVVPVPKEEIEREIREQATKFGLPVERVLALAKCESGLDWKAKNPNSTARGIFQFVIKTWEETESAKQGFERNNYKANIREAMIDLANGESWRWECVY